MNRGILHIMTLVFLLALSFRMGAQTTIDSLDGGYAKYLSDRGIGISLYGKGKYCDAVPYLESAHSYAPTDSILSEYLYFSYVNTLRNLDANKVFSSVPAVSVKNYGLKRSKPISSIYVEGGALFADSRTYWDESYIYYERHLVGNGGFASVDVSNELGSLCELSHHVGVNARNNPVEMRGFNSSYYNLRSQYVGLEYEVNAKFNVNSHWKITPYLRVGYESYDVVGFSLDTVRKEKKENGLWYYNNDGLITEDKSFNDGNNQFNVYPAPNANGGNWYQQNYGWNQYPYGGFNMEDYWNNMSKMYDNYWKNKDSVSYSYSHGSQNHRRWDILVGCNAAFLYGKHLADVSLSYFHGEEMRVIQSGLSYKIYPLGNINLYISPSIGYIWRGNSTKKIGELDGSFLAEVSAGGKIYKRLWGSTAFLWGNICDYHDRASHSFYTLSCETKLRCSAQLIYLLNQHLNIILTYKYIRKTSKLFYVDSNGNSNLKDFNQNDNVIAGGVQWNF